jgi:putative DNA primase/helicase
VTCKLNARIVIASNELPRLSDSSGAVASRMVLLRLSRSFYGSEDTALTAKLLLELPSIALWAVGGWKRLRDRGHFVQPQSSAGLLGELADLGSPIAEFVRERCAVEAEFRVSRDDIYGEYVRWCAEHGKKHPEDAAGFGRALRAAVPSLGDSQPRVDGKPVRFYLGIRLRTEF